MELNFETEIAQEQERQLMLFINWFGIIVIPGLLFAAYLRIQHSLIDGIIMFVSDILLMLIFIFRKKNIELCLKLLMILFYVAISIMAFTGTGMLNSVWLCLFPLQLVGSLLFHGRYTFFYAVYGFVLILGVGSLDAMHLLNHKLSEFATWSRVVNILLIYVVSSLTIYYVSKSLRQGSLNALAFAESLKKFNLELDQKVIERTDQLEESTQKLQQAMDQIVQSEKLASLGNMVAGVAHELNTPIGNALTISTTLKDRVREFKEELDKGQLKKSSLNQFLESADEIAVLVEKNCTRAAELVSSFKQVAVDQTSMRKRAFQLDHLLQELILTLKPQFKNTQIQIVLDTPRGITIHSYPGALEQVITNLLTNALIHAFGEKRIGKVYIKAAYLNESTVRIIHEDNGVGIPAEIQNRVFDPFFTTKLGHGGSGLGLYLAYNFITRALQGELKLKSEPGLTQFIIDLPITLGEGVES